MKICSIFDDANFIIFLCSNHLRFRTKHENATDNDAEQTKRNRTTGRNDEDIEASSDVDVLIAVIANPTFETSAICRHICRVGAN